MRRKYILLMIMSVLALGMGLWRVNVWWVEAQSQVYPKRGDWDYYVQACSHIPVDHPIIPTLLHSLNLFVKNPALTVLYMMTMGYTIVFFSVYSLSQLRGCHPIAGMIGFTLVASSTSYLSPTALKNIWGMAFLMVGLMIVSQLEKSSLKLKIAAFSTFIITFLTHTIAVFALFPVLICYLGQSLGRSSKHTKFFIVSLITLFTLIIVGASTAQLFRLGKLGNLAGDFLNNPLAIISYNVNRAMFHPENLTHFIMYSTSVITGVVYFGYTRRFDPMFFGLLFAYSGLFFLGSKPFAGRLHSTGISLLAVLYAYTLTMLHQFYRYLIGKLTDMNRQDQERQY